MGTQKNRLEHPKHIFKLMGKKIVTILPGLILAQNDDGPLKWAIGPYLIQIHANFQILMGHLDIFMGPLQNSMGPRILNIHIRA